MKSVLSFESFVCRGLELRSPGLHCKHLYLLSHLMIPILYMYVYVYVMYMQMCNIFRKKFVFLQDPEGLLDFAGGKTNTHNLLRTRTRNLLI